MTEIDQFDPPTDDGAFDDDRYGRASSGTTAPTLHYVNEAGVPEDVLA